MACRLFGPEHCKTNAASISIVLSFSEILNKTQLVTTIDLKMLSAKWLFLHGFNIPIKTVSIFHISSWMKWDSSSQTPSCLTVQLIIMSCQSNYLTRYEIGIEPWSVKGAIINDTVKEAVMHILLQTNVHGDSLSQPLINTLRPRQNGRHFADDNFNCIFLNENVWVLIKISLKFVPKVWINNIPTLVQIMAWRRPGDNPLSEPMMVSLLTHICVIWPQWVNTQQLQKGSP